MTSYSNLFARLKLSSYLANIQIIILHYLGVTLTNYADGTWYLPHIGNKFKEEDDCRVV